MTEIEHNIGNNRQKVEVTGLMETDPEYQLIVEANNIAVEIDGEFGRFQSFYYELLSSFLNYLHVIEIFLFWKRNVLL